MEIAGADNLYCSCNHTGEASVTCNIWLLLLHIPSLLSMHNNYVLYIIVTALLICPNQVLRHGLPQ